MRPPPSLIDHRLNRADTLRAVAIAILTIAVYVPAFHCGFVNFDDHTYVTENPHVLGGFTFENILWAFTTLFAANWHPLTWLSLQLDATMWTGDAAGYHLTNVLIHAANTSLVYLLLFRMTGAVGRSFVAAALFGLHPLHVESVAWVSERKDVLSVFFGLATLLAYIRYTHAPTRSRYLLVSLLFCLSLMAKPMLVTLPFTMLLLDIWPLNRVQNRAELAALVQEKYPLFLITVLSCAITYFAQLCGDAVRSFTDISFADRLLGAPLTYVVYLCQSFVPVELAVLYPLRTDVPIWQPLAGFTALTIITLGAIRFRRTCPAWLVGWLWFLGSLVPVIGLVSVGFAAHADRYTYWPHTGLFLAVVWAFADACNFFHVPIALRFVAASAILVACTILTRQQLTHWQSDEALWLQAVAVNPRDTYPLARLARNALRAGDLPSAEKRCEEMLALEPENMDAMLIQSQILHRQGRWNPK